MSTRVRPGSRAHFAALVAHDIADSCRRLRLPCAATIARTASTPAAWRDVAEELGAVAVGSDREHERLAAQRAAREMANAQVSAAVQYLVQLRGEGVSEWEADVVESIRVEALESFMAAS